VVIIVIDGRVYSWRQIAKVRRQQLEMWKAARAQQPALCPLKDDSRPAAERTASGRYGQPGLFK
jgi:hypothetical protein